MNFLMLSHVIPKPSLKGFDSEAKQVAGQEDPDFFPACPFTWAKPIHAYNCEYCWPKDVNLENTGSITNLDQLVELDTKEYMGKIQNDKVIERLMAMGGLRLAGILNTIFLEGEMVDGQSVKSGTFQGPYFAYDDGNDKE